jgi:hypothetical protein
VNAGNATGAPLGVDAEDADDSHWDGHKKKKRKRGKEEYQVSLATGFRWQTACTTALRRYFSSFSDRPFDKVLANQGEIACRVIRTCQTLGIPTIATYLVADGPNALHAQMADEAYSIGQGPHPTESYLLQDQILEISQTA